MGVAGNMETPGDKSGNHGEKLARGVRTEHPAVTTATVTQEERGLIKKWETDAPVGFVSLLLSVSGRERGLS